MTSERLKKARYWINSINQSASPLTYNRDRYQALVARLPKMDPKERGRIKGQTYTNDEYELSLEVPTGWTLDNSRTESLVVFNGPVAGVRGALQRMKMPSELGVQDFTKQIMRQWGVQQASARETEYPAGHGMVLQYGDELSKYRTLLLTRGPDGYTLMCQIPEEQYLQYIVDCEKIMRSLQIQ